ncbi:MAG: DNA replication and repair protein RecF [Acidimicrobiales bacterium]
MSHVAWVEVRQFRNLDQVRFEPDPDGLTVVTGDNGAGKTSLLEAVGYASTLSSFRGSPKESLVQRGAETSVIRLESVENDRCSLVEIEIVPERRDRVQRNRQRVVRAQELLETLRVSVFTPDDLALVKGGPQERRDFLDDALVAARPAQLTVRQTVERILRQRSALLRQAGGVASPDVLATLDVWDEKLAQAGGALVGARETFLAELQPLAIEAFRRLTGCDEELSLIYERSFSGELGEALARARRDDLRRAATTVGPQRDEIVIVAGGLDARTRLSQGRQRCATLALRLAAHGAVTRAAGGAPVLLLDDAFSELDEATARSLLAELPPGQAVLTTAGPIPTGARAAAVVHLAAGAVVG